MMSSAYDISQRILERCREMGFALAGIADAAPTERERELLQWLAEGKHGEMEYLRRNVELRIDPRMMVPEAQSVICVADRYAGETGERRNAETPKRNGPQGMIARYARGDDYHVVMRKRLTRLARELSAEFPGETFRACVDTAPVLEREIAQRAGLGAIGKNTMLIERGVGSYLLLGEIITTLRLEESPPAEPDPCGSCTRCIDACPTNAITPGSVDATRCISYLTIEHRSAIDERFHQAMGDWIFGCDVCQEVCPHNQPTERSLPRMSASHPAYAPRREGFGLLEILNWNEDARRQAFVKSAMKRARLDMMKRNALIAAGNALRRGGSEPLSAAIQRIAQDEAEADLVRQTARAIARSLKAAHSG